MHTHVRALTTCARVCVPVAFWNFLKTHAKSVGTNVAALAQEHPVFAILLTANGTGSIVNLHNIAREKAMGALRWHRAGNTSFRAFLFRPFREAARTPRRTSTTRAARRIHNASAVVVGKQP